MARGDNAMWWTPLHGWDLMKTDPRSHEVLARIRVPQANAAFDLATGFGAVWLTEGGSHPSVHKIDAQTQRPAARIQLASLWGSKGKRAYVATGERAVWATVNVLDDLFRIDPATGAVTATVPLGGHAGRLAVGEGAVWVIQAGAVCRVDPETNRITARIPIPGLWVDVGRIAVGGGSVWVSVSMPSMYRIDPKTNQVMATFQATLDTEARPNYYGIAQMVATKDTVWAVLVRFGLSFTKPSYGRLGLAEIDMRTNTVRSIRPLGEDDASRLFDGPSLAVSDDDVWVCLPSGLYVIPLHAPH